MKKSFTFIELLVVITIFALLTMIAVSLTNPIQQFKRSWDSKRKNNFSTMRNVLEDFYNDKGRYPKASEICYNIASSPRTDKYDKTACTCNICGKNSNSPSFSPYLQTLICDPQSPNQEYLYDFDCSQDNPSWYRIYTNISITADSSDIRELGCQYGCGPAPDFSFNYAVTSGQTDIERSTEKCSAVRLYQKDDYNNCNICKSPNGGDICQYGILDIYASYPCVTPCLP